MIKDELLYSKDSFKQLVIIRMLNDHHNTDRITTVKETIGCDILYMKNQFQIKRHNECVYNTLMWVHVN